MKRTMIILLCLICLTALSTFLYLRLPKFGKAPQGARLERIEKSPHYNEGRFRNLYSPTSEAPDRSFFKAGFEFLFNKDANARPKTIIPSVKTDLHAIDPQMNTLIWFGHSSYFLQFEGKRFLIDPVFSDNASPVPKTNSSFEGTHIYSVEDMPEIDYLLITHDHYDHLDYKSALGLREKVGFVFCGLGVGEHLEHWGYDSKKIIEMDWHEERELEGGIVIASSPTMHFSGRTFNSDNTLWLAFILRSKNYKIYFGGDSGYSTHFADAGKRFGGFDLAILENGQYNEAWRDIHLFPEECLKAAKDLNARRLLPGHSGRFALSVHAWDEPLRKISELNAAYGLALLTPKIGEIVRLDDESQTFEQWWLEITP